MHEVLLECDQKKIATSKRHVPETAEILSILTNSSQFGLLFFTQLSVERKSRPELYSVSLASEGRVCACRCNQASY